MASMRDIQKWFDRYHDEEFLEFDHIPADAKLHPRRDLCGLLYLHNLFGGEGDVIRGVYGKTVWLACGDDQLNKLTKKDVVYLLCCGIVLDSDTSRLAIVV